MMTFTTVTVVRLFNAVCFGIFLLGLLMLLGASAEVFDDALDGTKPSGVMTWVLEIAPIRLVWLAFPLLGGIAHWRCHQLSGPPSWSALLHVPLALTGGLACLGGAILVNRFTYLNGSKPITSVQVVANLLLLALLIAAIRRGGHPNGDRSGQLQRVAKGE